MENFTPQLAFPGMVIEKELKTSDRGCVYLVRDGESLTRYIYRTFSGNAEVYRAMIGLEYPNLPKVYEIKEEDGAVYVLEEYIQGDSLAFILEVRPLEEDLAKKFTVDVCRALSVLHGIGAVHRDIKPENIIIRGNEAVLIDFDASRICKALNTTDTQIMGTTGYAAPEQYGFSQTDARTDIYSVGIVLNEMLTCRHPSKQLAEGKIRDIIQKCTQINAAQRYSSAEQLIAALNSSKKVRKPFAHKLIPLLLSIAVILGAYALYRSFAEKEVPDEVPAEETETQTEIKEVVIPKEPLRSVPEIEVFNREKIDIPMDPWSGEIDVHTTSFKCDLDGDGETESYIFSVEFIDSPHENIVYYDRNTIFPDYKPRRDVHPCVWRLYPDGTLELATEFAQLLTDASVRIWRVDDLNSPEPSAWTMDYIWPGCVSVTFYPEYDGTWLYEISARLGEHELTARATSSFYIGEEDIND